MEKPQALGGIPHKLVTLLLVMVMLLLPTVEVLGASEADWARIKITSKPDPPYNADEVHKQVSSYHAVKSRPKSIFHRKEVFDYIGEASAKYGINPYVIVAMSIHEGTWGASPLVESHNNPFGMKCTTRPNSTCVGIYANYKDLQTAYDDKAWLLRNMYVAQGKDTFMSMISTYSPTSDGNVLTGGGGYVAGVGSHLSRVFNLTPASFELGEMVPGAGYESSGSTTMPSGMDARDVFMPFEDPKIASRRGVVGEDGDRDLQQNPYISYLVMSGGYKLAEGIKTFGYVMSAMLLGYISVMIGMYTMYIQGKAKYEIAQKILGETVVSNYGTKKGLKTLLIRISLGVIAMFFFLSGYFIDVMSILYYFIGEVLL